MKKQIPESVDLKLVDAVALIDSYAELICTLGREIGLECAVQNSQEIQKCVDWIEWYEEFTGRTWFKELEFEKEAQHGEMDARLAEKCKKGYQL